MKYSTTFWIIGALFTILTPQALAQGWNRHDSRNYTVLSQLSRQETINISNLMESIYHEYSQRFSFRRKVRGHFVLKVFKKRQELWQYLQSVGGSPNWVGAYIRKKRELVVCAEVSRVQFRSLLFHEGFHQFFEYYLANPPVWINEGLAEYFGAAVPKYKGYKFGIPIRRHLLLLSNEYNSRAMPGIGQVCTSDYSTFHDSSREKYFYAKSWLLVHYLVSEHRTILNSMIQNIKKKQAISYPKYFGSAARLENALKKYLARLLEASGEKLYQEGKSQFDRGNMSKALRYFTRSLSKNPHQVQARHYRGLLHYENKNYRASLRDLTKVIDSGYDWAPTFYYRGLAHFRMGRRKEALRDLRIARRLAPNNTRIQNALRHVLNDS